MSKKSSTRKSASENRSQRRRFLKSATGAVAATAAASGFAAPAISQGRLQWRLVTTWPKNFPGLGTGANLLGDLITKGSGGRLSVKVFGAKEVVPAFEALDADHVISLIRPDNIASIRVAEKLGERQERSVELFGEETLVYGVARPA